MSPELVATLKRIETLFGVLVVAAKDHYRMLAELVSLRLRLANADRRLAKRDREHEQLIRAYENASVLIAAHQRRAAQAIKERDEERAQLGHDLSELMGERDDAKRLAAQEKARRAEAEYMLRALVLATQHGEFCTACGCRADMCSPACARFVAAGIVAPTSTAVAEA